MKIIDIIQTGILSHNSTSYTVFALWYAIRNKDKKVLICANKFKTAKDILSRILIPREICSLDNTEITADKLFDATTLILISGFKTNRAGNIIQAEIERIEEQYKKELSGSIAIWGAAFLTVMTGYDYWKSGRKYMD
jgi:hypothetical protein